MIFIILLFLAFNSLSSTRSTPVSFDENNRVPVTLFGRDLPVPDIAQYRTLQDIVWSCLATIFACTWVAVHPNLPGPYDSGWTKLKRRVTMMIYALLAPEFMTMWAMLQWMAARRIANKFNEMPEQDPEKMDQGNGSQSNQPVTDQEDSGHPQHDDEEYDCIQCCLSCWNALRNPSSAGNAGMKGYWAMVKNAVLEWFQEPDRSRPKDFRWTITHGYFVQMGGFILCSGERMQRVLTFHNLQGLIERGYLDKPKVTEDEISDKSKGDFLTKLFVVLQTTWFVFQCVARWIMRMPVTELEVITLAFATLNIITYALWWKKPQNVMVAISLERKPTSSVPGGWQRTCRTHGDGRDAPWSVWWSVVDGIEWRVRERADVIKTAMTEVFVMVEETLSRVMALDMAMREMMRELVGRSALEDIEREFEKEMGSMASQKAREVVWEVAFEMTWEMKEALGKITARDPFQLSEKYRRVWEKVARAHPSTSEGEWEWKRELEMVVESVVGRTKTQDMMAKGKITEVERELERVEAAQISSEHPSWFVRNMEDTGWYELPWLVLQAVMRPLGKMSGLTSNVLRAHSLRIPTFWKEETDSRVDFPILGIGIVFGGLHLIPGWEYNFPSTVEQWLWRSSTLVITIEPVMVFLLRVTDMFNDRHRTWLSRSLFKAVCIPTMLGIPLYLVSRLILLVLAVTTLRDLASGNAFENIEWTTYIPHI